MAGSSQILAALLGLAIGLAADRLAARWPAHSIGPRRGIGWRSAAVVLVAGLAFGALPGRWSDPRDVVVLGLWFAALVVLLATDLDQRLLPDAITLPLVPLSLAVLVGGWDPILGGGPAALPSGLAAGLGLPLVLGVTDLVFHGGLGMGDLKLAVSLGLMAGVEHLVVGLALASLLGAVVLIGLLLARRITLRSYVPFGPILIVGGILAALRP